MLRQMERSTIHLLHKRGKSQREIARELGRSRATVARALREPVDRRRARRRRRSKLTDPYRERIASWVTEGLTAVRMFELARDDPEQPYPGQLSVFRAAVRRERHAQAQSQAIAEVPVRFEGLPGEYLQVDWGEIRALPLHPAGAGDALLPGVSAEVQPLDLGALHDRDAPGDAVPGAGGLRPGAGLGALGAGLRQHEDGHHRARRPAAADLAPALLQLAAEFDFHPEACWPGAGNQKGSVESLVKWVKGNFLAGRVFADDADLADAVRGVAGRTPTPRPSQATDVAPLARLVEEAAKGGPLPR